MSVSGDKVKEENFLPAQRTCLCGANDAVGACAADSLVSAGGKYGVGGVHHANIARLFVVGGRICFRSLSSSGGGGFPFLCLPKHAKPSGRPDISLGHCNECWLSAQRLVSCQPLSTAIQFSLGFVSAHAGKALRHGAAEHVSVARMERSHVLRVLKETVAVYIWNMDVFLCQCMEFVACQLLCFFLRVPPWN